MSDPGTEVTFECFHNIDNYDQINWYQQTDDRGLVFMGYLVQQGVPEAKFRDKISFDGGANKGQKSTIKVLNLDRNDTAVYFCAASTQSYHPLHFCTKNPNHNPNTV